MQVRRLTQAPGGARHAAPLYTVAALIALAPTFQAAGHVAERESKEAARPQAVFPVRGQVDWGDAADRFGAPRSGHMHEGQDMFAAAGTPLVAVRDGRVVETGDDGGRGNYIAIWSRQADSTFLYLHMLQPTPLATGDTVRVGQHVGRVGCTGSCWGNHLHFEVRRGRGTAGPPHDPLRMLKRLAARRAARR
jgi:murein DD-endopeptidase MepM/ murein hydrolase activator NlpD